MNSIVVGLDPGSRCTGVGVIREGSGCLELLYAGTIRPPAKDPLAERLGYIFSRTQEVLEEYRPQCAAIEDVFTAYNAASALKLGQARGAVVVACTSRGIPVHSFQPTLVKKSLVGQGRAGKDQVAFMVGRLLGARPDWSQDSSDALAVAITYLNQKRFVMLSTGEK
ncbi:MAG: crossover junction endodeoxyribonuclease RuvC [Desulfonatronovibrionaceae bacterium]